MSNITRWIQIVAFSGGLGLAAAPAARAETLSNVDLSGTWILNESLSDDPREVMKQKMDETQSRQGGRFRGGSGMAPGGGRRAGGGYGGGDREQMHERMSQLEAVRKLVILQSDDQVTMIPEGRDTVSVVTDGETHKVKTVLGEAELQATWKDLALEVRAKGPGGREVVRWYRINSDGRLEVVTTFELPRVDEKVEIVMRYDEAK
jgi:hypothetical protein